MRNQTRKLYGTCRRLLAAIAMLVICPLGLQAQVVNCNAITPSLIPVEGQWCCFDFFVDYQPAASAEITQARITILSPNYISSAATSAPGFTLNWNAATATWNRGTTLLDYGNHQVGSLCIYNVDPCFTAVIEYFDYTYQQWVCSDTISICCSDDVCCEYLEATVTRTDECCFDVAVFQDENIPCDITEVRLSLVGSGFNIIDDGGYGSFNSTVNGAQITFDDGGQALSTGLNSLGFFCVQAEEPCFKILVEYYDSVEGEWICSDSLLGCCPLDPTGTLKGTKFNDLDKDGVWDATEPALSGWQIVIYDYMTGLLDTTTTDINGNYTFTNLTGCLYSVFEIQQNNWIQTAPSSRYNVKLAPGQTVNGLVFGNFEPDCADSSEQTFLAGVKDNFAGGNSEPTAPGADLLEYMNRYKGGGKSLRFDHGGIDRAFGHTFTNFLPPANCDIVSAMLKVALRANNHDLSYNDKIHIVENGEPVWIKSIGSLVGYQWDPGSRDTVCIDLTNLDPGNPSGHPTNVLSNLNDGDLDFFIQDDTGVDWAELHLLQQCCPDCCDSLEASFTPVPDTECCYTFKLSVADSIPCEITKIEFSLNAPRKFTFADTKPGYAVSGAGSDKIEWTRSGGGVFPTGMLDVGTFCVDRTDCFTLTIRYFDSKEGEWICEHKFDLCCGQPSQTATGVAEPGELLDMHVAPNPAHSMVSVRYTLDQDDALNLQVFDYLGTLVRSIDLGRKGQGIHVYSMPIQTLPSGYYIIRLQTAGGVVQSLPLTIHR